MVVLEDTEIKKMEEPLRQLQKMVTLGLLAGGVAHDLNNILQPIIGFSDLLLEKFEVGSEEYIYLTTIAESAHRAKDLVSQIIAFSRRSQTDKGVHDVVQVVDEVIKLVRSALPASITLKENLSRESMPVFCDSSQIHQVLMNLCVNARQAIPDTGVIEIAVETTELENFQCIDGTKLFGSHVRLAVTDSGGGMDRETLSRIFNPLFTTKEAGKGTGFGLSTVFEIVQAHGGGITVCTEPGTGTTFEVLLPRSACNIEKLPNTPDPIRDHGTENILFVDDEAAITKLGEVFLGQGGYNVTAVSDGQRALQIFAANPEHFDLVVTDQTMPNMTGERLSYELLKIRSDIPIILCSGHIEAVRPECSKANGISSYLYKPVTPKEMRRVVREVLDQAKEVAART